MLFIKEDGAVALNDGVDVIVFPLQREELELLLNDKNYFENYLNLKYDIDAISGDILDTYKSLIDRHKQEPSDYNSLWVVASVKYKAIVGHIIFDSQPDITGTTSISFLTGRQYRRQNIMTSAVGLITGWALDNGASLIRATTEVDNTPAIRVLEKNKYTKVNTTKTHIYFEKG